jgi:hypothetical protein
MALGMKELVAEARAQVQAVTPQQAHDSGELVLDVREPPELQTNGRVAGALNVPRGVLESQADPSTSMANERLTRHRAPGACTSCADRAGARRWRRTRSSAWAMRRP